MLSPFDVFLIIFLVFPRVGKNTLLISRNPGYQGQVNLFMYFNNNHEPDRFGKDEKIRIYGCKKYSSKRNARIFLKKG